MLFIPHRIYTGDRHRARPWGSEAVDPLPRDNWSLPGSNSGDGAPIERHISPTRSQHLELETGRVSFLAHGEPEPQAVSRTPPPRIHQGFDRLASPSSVNESSLFTASVGTRQSEDVPTTRQIAIRNPNPADSRPMVERCPAANLAHPRI